MLLLGGIILGEYDASLHAHGRKPLFATVATAMQTCVAMQLTAAICGFIAMIRGNKGWVVPALISTLLAVPCFFGEL
jgi:hypothetical protein